MNNGSIVMLPTIAVIIVSAIIILIMRWREARVKQKRKAAGAHETDRSDQAAPRATGDPQALLKQAQARLVQRQYDEALKLCRQSVELNPKSPAAYYLLSSIHLGKGNCVDAIAASRRAIALKRGCTGAYLNLGKALRAQGDIDAALKEMTLGLDQGDVDWEYRELSTVLAAMYASKRDYHPAVQVLDRATKRCPKDGELWYFLGVFSFDGGDYARAISAYKEALLLGTAASASRSQLHSELGRTYAAMGQWEKAFEEHGLSIEMEPADAENHRWLAEAYFKKQDYLSAIASYRDAIQLDPSQARPYVGLADAYLHQEQYGEAAEALTRALSLKDIHPETLADLYNLLTVSYLGLEKYEDAVQVGRTALTMKSTTCATYERDAHYHLGVALYELKRYPEALEQFKLALSFAGPDTDIPSSIYVRMGRIYVATQEWDKAMDAYRQSLKREDSVDTRILLAGVYMCLERYQEALLELQRAMAAGELTEAQKTVINEFFGVLGAEGYLTPVQ
jgi:tetratricopeptide (TPR) repeat protein